MVWAGSVGGSVWKSYMGKHNHMGRLWWRRGGSAGGRAALAWLGRKARYLSLSAAQ